MMTEGDIGRIVERIVVGYGPLVVGTFGSYAVGSAHDGSDLDLVVIKTTAEQPHARGRTVGRLLFGVLHPLDIHVFTPGEFEESVKEALSFAWIVARQARLYHWMDSARDLVPSLLPRAEDTATVADPGISTGGNPTFSFGPSRIRPIRGLM